MKLLQELEQLINRIEATCELQDHVFSRMAELEENVYGEIEELKEEINRLKYKDPGTREVHIGGAPDFAPS